MCGVTRTHNKEHEMSQPKSVDKAGKIKPGEFANQKIRVDSVEVNQPRSRSENTGKKQVTIQLKKAR